MNEIIDVENKNKNNNHLIWWTGAHCTQYMTNCNGILLSKSINEIYQMEMKCK